MIVWKQNIPQEDVRKILDNLERLRATIHGLTAAFEVHRSEGTELNINGAIEHLRKLNRETSVILNKHVEDYIA